MGKENMRPSPEKEYFEPMIRLALYKNILEEAEELEKKPLDFELPDPAPTIKRIDRAERKHRTKSFFRKTLPRVAKVAAIVVLITNLVGVISIACIDSLRVKVLNFMIERYDTHTSVGFVETGEALEVPSGWHGNYFPQFIPDGFTVEVLSCNDDTSYISYRKEGNGYLTIVLATSHTYFDVNSERAEGTDAVVQGQAATLVQMDGDNKVIWRMGSEYIMISSSLEPDVILEIAESFVMIKK